MTTSGRAVLDDPDERTVIAAQLPDSAVLAIAALHGGARCYVSGPSDAFTALAVEELPTEFGGYGDPVALAEMLLTVDGWTCVEVKPADAPVVAHTLSEAGRGDGRFYGSVYFELRAPVARIAHDSVRLLGPEDSDLVRDADPELGLAEVAHAWPAAIVAGAVVDRRLVAKASCVARSAGYADIGVTTLEAYRGRGLATAAASAVATRLQQMQLIPVWSAGETNWASLRIAERLGFTTVARRTYVIPPDLSRPHPVMTATPPA